MEIDIFTTTRQEQQQKINKNKIKWVSKIENVKRIRTKKFKKKKYKSFST